MAAWPLFYTMYVRWMALLADLDSPAETLKDVGRQSCIQRLYMKDTNCYHFSWLSACCRPCLDTKILFSFSLEDWFTCNRSLSLTGAVERWRRLLGPTDSDLARLQDPGSIRALFGSNKTQNACHGSDSQQSASIECNFFFFSSQVCCTRHIPLYNWAYKSPFKVCTCNTC